jgi:hypothetical protein
MPEEVLSLTARNDQTKLCGQCAARFGGTTCPGCGLAAAFDLGRVKDRRRAIAWAKERFEGRRLRAFLGPGPRGFPAPTAALLLIAAALAVLAAAGHPLWPAAIGAALVGFVLVIRGLVREEPPQLPALKPSSDWSLYAIGVLPPALPTGSTDRVARRGSVHSDAPLVAPLSGEPCVAFRLVGRVGDCLVDDAAAAPFTLTSRAGPVVTVLSSACAVELAVRRTQAEPQARERVRRFLGERGIDASTHPIELAEGVIRIGDEVTVEGLLESVASGAGYRGRAQAELLVGQSDLPVVVRRA